MNSLWSYVWKKQYSKCNINCLTKRETNCDTKVPLQQMIIGAINVETVALKRIQPPLSFWNLKP